MCLVPKVLANNASISTSSPVRKFATADMSSSFGTSSPFMLLARCFLRAPKSNSLCIFFHITLLSDLSVGGSPGTGSSYRLLRVSSSGDWRSSFYNPSIFKEDITQVISICYTDDEASKLSSFHEKLILPDNFTPNRIVHLHD